MTGDPGIAPSLEDVTVSWEGPMGVKDASGGFSFAGAIPNPALGTAVLAFSLRANSSVELAVYNISGRVVSRREDHCPAGVNQLEVCGLAGGVYIARLYC